jgi:hypothetical protein
MPRQATVIIADEIYYNLYGKAILQGIYNTDLVIPVNPSTAPQLLFFFIIETDIGDPFNSLSVEVALPEEAVPVKNFVMIPPVQWMEAQAKAQPERTTFTVRHPLLIPAPVLRVGRIVAKVIHERGEILVSPQWISLNPIVAAAAAKAN